MRPKHSIPPAPRLSGGRNPGFWGLGAVLTWLGFVQFAGPLNAQTNSILFDRDIRPILEQSCLRCHGEERPKSGFRLTDRESALKGGDGYSDDVVPGNSAASKLIQFVSGVPEDMLMPPADKGERLTAPQIQMLRQWIDEGAAWGVPRQPEFNFAVTPGIRWIDLQGDENKFRELEGVPSGWGGGIEQFSLSQQRNPLTRLSAEGHYFYDDHDGAIKLSLDRRDVGFMRVGFEQWRSYSDDTGGYYRPGVPPSFDLNQQLALDHGRAWVDFGLVLPEWPRLVLGYEYRYRDGNEDTLQWGFAGDHNIFPAARQIDETAHVLKFDIAGELGGWEIEDRARVEFYELSTARDNYLTNTIGPGPDILSRINEQVSAVQGVNTLRLEKSLRDWWLLSGGWLFSRYNGESSLNQMTVDPNFLPLPGNFWSSDDMILKRANQVVSATSLFTIFEGLNAALGAQGEWMQQEGVGEVHLDYGNPAVPSPSFLRPATVSANLDRWRTSENGSLRFTRIPWTVVYAEARLDQERTSQFENMTFEPSVEDPHDGLLRDTESKADWLDWRGGFTASPRYWISFGGSYRHRVSDSDYDHVRDFNQDTNGWVLGDGYSAFIEAQEIDTDAVEARIVLRPLTWLKTTLSYERVKTDFTTKTDGVFGGGTNGIPGGVLTAAKSDADVYSANLTLTPWRRLHLGGTFSYRDNRTVAADDGEGAVAPYDGDVYSVLANARFILSERTDLFAAYAFSKSDYGQNNYAGGLPLGMEFTRHSASVGIARKLSDACAVSLRYAYYDYAEPSAGGVNDYTAHGVFATFNYRWQ